MATATIKLTGVRTEKDGITTVKVMLPSGRVFCEVSIPTAACDLPVKK